MGDLYSDDPMFDPTVAAERLGPDDRALATSAARAWLDRLGPEPPEAEEAFMAGFAFASQFRWE
jgi:hypothetical protein